MDIKRMWIVLHIIALLVPFMGISANAGHTTASDITWPAEFEGKNLERLELSDMERGFSRGFPGRIARFTDGSREIIIRRVERATRKLHPASDCLKGGGYSVKSLPVRADPAGNHWGCVRAVQGGRVLNVCERIYDEAGNSWSDTSSWYWSAVLEKSSGPWWAVTVAEEGSL